MNDLRYGKLSSTRFKEYTRRLQSEVRNRLGRKKCLRMDLSLERTWRRKTGLLI